MSTSQAPYCDRPIRHTKEQEFMLNSPTVNYALFQAPINTNWYGDSVECLCNCPRYECCAFPKYTDKRGKN